MKNNRLAGITIIVFGLLYLAFQIMGQLNLLRFNSWDFWPLIILGFGLLFELLYFRNKQGVGYLVPGGILITIGTLHLFETITGWQYAQYTWPVYIFALFIAFFQVYLATKQSWAYVIAIFFLILTTFLGTIAFGDFLGKSGIEIVISILLIVIGFLFVISAYKKEAS